ncbi:MAG: carboxymuconolactone decarboxylase family protein [Terriglobales bacterium]
MARRHGWSQDQLDHLDEFETRSDFSEQEKAALRFAERMTRESHNVDEALWADLRRHFDEGEVVELAAAIGLFNYFNRFNNALEMEPTK